MGLPHFYSAKYRQKSDQNFVYLLAYCFEIFNILAVTAWVVLTFPEKHGKIKSLCPSRLVAC